MHLKRIIFILIAGMSLITTSCYSDYLFLRYESYHGAQWNETRTKVIFVASTAAYHQAKGITQLPDGGSPKYLLNEVWLYTLDTSTMALTKLSNFNDLSKVMRNRWTTEIIYTDTSSYYKAKPTTEWEQYIKWAGSKEDSLNIIALEKKYSNIFKVDVKSNSAKIADIESDAFENYDFQKNKIGLTELNSILLKLPVAEWGLEIQKIEPNSDNKYIDDLIYTAKNGSPTTKRAIIEQIVAKKSKKEINAIIERIENHKNSLDGVELMEYELYSKETYKLLKALL